MSSNTPEDPNSKEKEKEEGNIFDEVLTNAKGVEEKYLGSDYPYYKNIKSPSEIGMSSKGSLKTLGKDIKGLISYVELLVSGKSNASATGGPLGNKFFLNTGAKCKDTVSGKSKDRYIYIDNVPEGNVPLLSSAAGVNFTEFRGLIPGTISNLNAFNPYTIMQGFMMGSNPECQEVTMETIDNHNNKFSETHYMTLVDIQNTDPCTFPDNKNPVTGAVCRESFANSNGNGNSDREYITCLLFGIIGATLMWKVSQKM